MVIVFPAKETWDGNREVVTFPAERNGDRISCSISIEALTDHFGSDRGSDPLDTVRNNREPIERKAEGKIRAGLFEGDGSVLLMSRDF